MREKIKNPVVVLYKRETSDSYAVSITDGSQNMHDGLLMAAVSPDDSDYSFATFAMVGYYMAAEIEKLRAQRAALAAENVALLRLRNWHMKRQKFTRHITPLSQSLTGILWTCRHCMKCSA